MMCPMFMLRCPDACGGTSAWTRWGWWAGLLVLLWWGVGCGDERAEGWPARGLLVAPGVVTFPGVSPGREATVRVALRNAGDAALTLQAVRFVPDDGSFRAARADGPGVGVPGWTLEPGADVELDVTWAPMILSEDGVTGDMTIDWTGGPRGAGRTAVRLQTAAVAASLAVSPDRILFPRVAPGREAVQPLQLSSVGTIDLVIEEIMPVVGTIDLVIEEIMPVDPEEEFALVEADQARLPIPLAASGGQAAVTIRYRPGSRAARSGQVRIRYSSVAGTAGVMEVPLEAEGEGPCLEIAPGDGFSFGTRALRTTPTERFTLRSCGPPGTAPVQVTSLEMLQERGRSSSAAFALQEALELPLALASGAEATFDVAFRPEEEGREERAWLAVGSTDATEPLRVISLRGLGSDNVCPLAQARCRVQGSADPGGSNVQATPRSRLMCSAAGSSDPDGTVASWRWTVTERPDGSWARVESPDQSDTLFWVDLGGSYQLTLEVFDDRGTPSCEPAVVDIEAIPTAPIHLEIAWIRPDPDAPLACPGCEHDFDLHVLGVEPGCWTESPADLHWRNRNPAWGEEVACSQVRDDLSDDLDLVVCERPPVGRLRVGVNHFHDGDLGPATVILRGWLLSALAVDLRRSLARGEFWLVADIAWPSAAVTLRDEVYDTIRSAPCR
jgi:hypothetical protein